jgi:hypothetical protein
MAAPLAWRVMDGPLNSYVAERFTKETESS